jgi:cytochrome oxidase Cu insertion factor (SCO1/SenC/PrrC family)
MTAGSYAAGAGGCGSMRQVRVKNVVHDAGTDRVEVDATVPQRRVVSNKVLVIATAVAVVVAGLGYLTVRHRQLVEQHNAALSQIRASGIPASVSTPLANLMGLSPLPTQPAPNFTLTDQHGQTMSLASFAGRAVVLEFMDPNCVDICPIVSQEFVDAYHDLGAAASRAVFLAVNVNPYHVDVASMAAYTTAHQLDTVPSWHFLTGPVSSLQTVWRDYNVDVVAPSATADVIHTSVAYFIDPSGRERYAAFPAIDHTAAGDAYLPAGPLAQWGVGIAKVTESMS